MREPCIYSPKSIDYNDPPRNVVFGNGVKAELKVWERATHELYDSKGTLKDLARKHYLIDEKPGFRLYAPGTDVIKVHFTPATSLDSQVNKPKMVPENEKLKIALDCLDGFLSLAMSLVADDIIIEDHHQDEDLYLLADTHEQFAAFLRHRVGFRGSLGGKQAWILKSELASDRIQHHILLQYKLLQNVRYRE